MVERWWEAVGVTMSSLPVGTSVVRWVLQDTHDKRSTSVNCNSLITYFYPVCLVILPILSVIDFAKNIF